MPTLCRTYLQARGSISELLGGGLTVLQVGELRQTYTHPPVAAEGGLRGWPEPPSPLSSRLQPRVPGLLALGFQPLAQA